MTTTYIVRKTSGRPDRRGNGGGSGYGHSSGRSSYGGGSRVGSSRGGYQGGGSRGRSGGSRGGARRVQEMSIDLSKLINKAVPGEPEEVFVPVHAFKDFPIDERLKNNIITKGYTTPTPIQDKAIPEVLKGNDVVGLANTGTGKTATFLIPLIDKILKLRALNENHRVLVMVPTRELAIQIEQEYWGFAKALQMNAVVCVGGAGIEPQIRVLRRTPNFVIGTPGRLKDLEERGEIRFKDFGTVVLDEADRMLDMGFIDDMRAILGKLPREHQTLFFSATLSRDIERLIGEFLNNPVRISVKTRDTARTIDQDVIRTNGENKLDVLIRLLKGDASMDKVLVFGRTKHGVERLARDLAHAGIASESIHGDKTHGKRQKALGMFKRDHVRVLVATDVAARGLDISGVSHVINFDLPATYEDYTHRIGRTGRAGKTGKALTFIS